MEQRVLPSALPPRTSTAYGSPQSGHTDSNRPSVSSAAGIPNASHAQLAYHHRPGTDPVRRRHGRKRVRHPDRVGAGLEHERMRLVQEPPALDHLTLVTQLTRERRAAELDKAQYVRFRSAIRSGSMPHLIQGHFVYARWWSAHGEASQVSS